VSKKHRKQYDARLAEIERRLSVLEPAQAQLSAQVAQLDPVALESLRGQALNAIRGIGRKQQALEAAQEPAAAPPAPMTLPTLAEARRRLPGVR
jgi:hypothetical protein